MNKETQKTVLDSIKSTWMRISPDPNLTMFRVFFRRPCIDQDETCPPTVMITRSLLDKLKDLTGIETDNNVLNCIFGMFPDGDNVILEEGTFCSYSITSQEEYVLRLSTRSWYMDYDFRYDLKYLESITTESVPSIQPDTEK